MKDYVFNIIKKTARNIVKVNFKAATVQIYQYKFMPWPDAEQTMPLENFVDFVLKDNKIAEEDQWKFALLCRPDIFLNTFKSSASDAFIYYSRIQNGQKITSRASLIYIDSDPKPEDGLFLVSDITENQAEIHRFSHAFANNMYKIVKGNLSTHLFTDIKNSDVTENNISAAHIDDYVLQWTTIEKDIIHPDDLNSFRKHIRISALAEYFDSGNKLKQIHYRRKIGELYRWVKMTVLISPDYSPENKVIYFYIEDAHESLQEMISSYSALNYSQIMASKPDTFSNEYYSNMQKVLHIFTDPYVDFYMVDLEKDLYIKYKPKSGLLAEDIAYIGNYSESSANYIANQKDRSQDEALLEYSTSEKLRKHLMDKITLSYTFKGDDGITYRTTCQKIESKNNIPSKVLCRTIIEHKPEHVLKIKTFGNFEVFLPDGSAMKFSRKQNRNLLAYLIDKRGFPVTSRDIVQDVLEKDISDMKAIKYVSTLIGRTTVDLKNAGFKDVIIKEQKTIRINPSRLDCDYYHLLNGDIKYWADYSNEYMKEYSWAEATNAEIMELANNRW